MLLKLWCVPRSLSTAYEKMVEKRGDFIVLGEPYCNCYLKTAGVSVSNGDSAQLFSQVTDDVLKLSSTSRVFVKEMAHHVVGYIADEVFERGENTFLIRDPRLSIPSLYTIQNYYSEKDTGFDSQLALFEKTRIRTGRVPVVIDGEALRQDPVRVVTAYFEALGLDPMLDALNWNKGGRSDWAGREEWHTAAGNSTGFAPPACEPDLDRFPLRVRQTIERCLPIYEHLLGFAVHVG
jgi:hypothetical protein